ncbi:MAG: hypothetical protein VR64_06205 [Desulfatitalea sp. BRH_c12]|nr:MAG: hypothetical protein VR64_06205 [Desulfatitalea sp. BRH_c12]
MDLRLERRSALKTAVLVLGEGLLIFGCTLIVRVWQDTAVFPFTSSTIPFFNAAIFTLLCQMCIYFCGLYYPGLRFRLLEQFVGLAEALIIAFAIALIWLLIIGRSVNPEAIFLVFGLLLFLSKAWRLLLEKVFATGFFSQRIIFLGTNECVRKIYQALTSEQKAKQGDKPLTVVAIADWQGSSCSFALQPETPYVALNNCFELVALTEKYKTRKVMVCKQVADTMTAEEVCTLKHQGIQFCVDDDMHEAITGWRDPAGLDPRKLVFSESFQHSMRRFFKRTSDIVIAAMLLVILSPVMLAIIVKLKWSSTGKVFETRPCVGLRKKCFNRYFFSFSKPVSNAFLHRYLPGLPQLWNVLYGDMSLVGPCPIAPDESEKIIRDVLIFDERYTVRPGITGWAQVNCTGYAPDTHFRRMFGYDLFYLGHLSLFMDIVVLMRINMPQMPAGFLVEDDSLLLREK